MITISQSQIAHLASYSDLVEVLRLAFQQKNISPERHVHELSRAGEQDGSLLLMPAWTDTSVQIDNNSYAGLKTVVVLPDNQNRNAPTVQASYQLFDGQNGQLLAVMDGNELTARRTACASALAADYLAKKNACKLLMIGAGVMSGHLVRAHASVRPIKQVKVFNRSIEKAKVLVTQLNKEGFDASLVENLSKNAANADIISCATTSITPIILGEWIAAGTHIDLVGAFRPDMRETDGHCISRSDVFVDTRDGTMSEAGDLLQAGKENCFTQSDIVGDLFQLTRAQTTGRKNHEQITLFKSCGAALEDLAAAIHVFQQCKIGGKDLSQQ